MSKRILSTSSTKEYLIKDSFGNTPREYIISVKRIKSLNRQPFLHLNIKQGIKKEERDILKQELSDAKTIKAIYLLTALNNKIITLEEHKGLIKGGYYFKIGGILVIYN